jgi:LmbE family N-acetylglucosaminyl deacetylase
MQGHVYIPDGVDLATALARTTHLGVGAHADDLEFMAWHPILHCHDREDAWFAAVTVSDGRGSPRSGPYREFSDDQMRDVRLEEQRAAARLGRYSVLYCLDYPSAVIRDGRSPELRADLSGIIDASAPRELYTHNPADRHATHTALACAVIDAARAASHRPERPTAAKSGAGSTGSPTPSRPASTCPRAFR